MLFSTPVGLVRPFYEVVRYDVDRLLTRFANMSANPSGRRRQRLAYLSSDPLRSSHVSQDGDRAASCGSKRYEEGSSVPPGNQAMRSAIDLRGRWIRRLDRRTMLDTSLSIFAMLRMSGMGRSCGTNGRCRSALVRAVGAERMQVVRTKDVYRQTRRPYWR